MRFQFGVEFRFCCQSAEVRLLFEISVVQGIVYGKGGSFAKIGEQGEILFSKPVGFVYGVNIDDPSDFRTADHGDAHERLDFRQFQCANEILVGLGVRV